MGCNAKIGGENRLWWRIALEALQIEMRYKISFWHALILHAAETAGAAVLYSEDLPAGQSYGSTRVVNPLTD